MLCIPHTQSHLRAMDSVLHISSLKFNSLTNVEACNPSADSPGAQERGCWTMPWSHVIPSALVSAARTRADIGRTCKQNYDGTEPSHQANKRPAYTGIHLLSSKPRMGINSARGHQPLSRACHRLYQYPSPCPQPKRLRHVTSWVYRLTITWQSRSVPGQETKIRSQNVFVFGYFQIFGERSLAQERSSAAYLFARSSPLCVSSTSFIIVTPTILIFWLSLFWSVLITEVHKRRRDILLRDIPGMWW